ncbi:MAG: DNA/RNA non-specific endonuclease, partial [Ginsengibacter sp.]
MFRKLYVAGLLIFSLTYVSCKKDAPSTGGNTPPDEPLQTVFLDNDNLLMGNPSNATHANENNYLLGRPAYTVSYSRERAIPNWVSWHLSTADLGGASRQNLFIPDPLLPN